MEKNPTMLFVVAAALINQDNRILVQKRPKNKMMEGLWEFPGGKLEQGEMPEAALARELREEVAVAVQEEDFDPLTFASEPLNDRYLMLLLYVCRRWEGEARSLENTEVAWVTIEEMRKLPMPPADAPFISVLENYLAQNP